MPVLDDNGNPISFDDLLPSPDPSAEPEPVEAEAAPEDDSAELTDVADAEDGVADAGEDSPEQATFDPDDEEQNPYVRRAREAEERLQRFERQQAEATARQQQAEWENSQRQKLTAQQQIIARAREMDPEQLANLLPHIFQAWNAEVQTLAQRSAEALNTTAWDREIDLIAREKGLTPEETNGIRSASDSTVARELADTFVRTRTGYEKQIQQFKSQVHAKTAARRDAQAAERQAAGAERVGGSGMGAAPAVQSLTPLQILRQEINGDPNMPLRVGG